MSRESSPKSRKQRSPFYAQVYKDKDPSRHKKPWCLTIITRSAAGRSRTRQFFASRQKAKQAAENAENNNISEGLSALDVPTELRAEALKAAKILGGRATLVAASEYFMAHANPAGGNKKLSEAVTEYTQWQRAEGASAPYITDFSWRLKRLATYFPANKKIHEIGWLDLNRYLNSLSLKPAGRQNEIRNLRPMFNWAVDQKYLASSPFPEQALFTRKKAKIQGDVRVLTLKEVQKVLAHAGDLLPHVVFGLFLGIRPDETKALLWVDVDWTKKRLIVNNRNSTTHDRRPLDIPEIALAWLEPWTSATGSISDSKKYRRRLNALVEKTGLKPWPKDVLRHSFASYWLAQNEDESRLKTLMGHHWSSSMLRKHYLNRGISAEAASAYWALQPKTADNIIPMPSRHAI